MFSPMPSQDTALAECAPGGSGYNIVVRVLEHIAMAECFRGGERLRLADILVGDKTGTCIVRAKNGERILYNEWVGPF